MIIKRSFECLDIGEVASELDGLQKSALMLYNMQEALQLLKLVDWTVILQDLVRIACMILQDTTPICKSLQDKRRSCKALAR